MAICDVLNEAKDLALNEKNPQLFTIATLTGHCVLSYGNNYSVFRLLYISKWILVNKI